MPRPSPLPSGLGPDRVGSRVVVRSRVAGETGPSGGPAMTDVIGVLESWDDEALAVRREDGSLVRIARADLVTGKPVPPRASVRARLPADEVARVALESWPAMETEPLGAWLLRASGGFSARANSALLVGDPGRPWDEAVATARAFYEQRGLPPWAQVTVGSDADERARREGWEQARPGESDSQLQVASVAQSLRLAGRGRDDVAVGRSLTDGWLATDDRARERPEAARAVLEGPDHVAFATVEVDGVVVARGRAAMAEASDWVGITDVWVDPDRRGSGLARAVLAELLDWAAERGARTAYLQVRADNAAALALYVGLGFATHHAYRYLLLPG